MLFAPLTIYPCSRTNKKPKPSDVERAIAQMTDDTQGLHQAEKTKLEALLYEFADVLSVRDDDLGRPPLSNIRST